MGAGLYGAALGVALVWLPKLMPRPLGAVILWSLICAQLAWGAVICWRRTGLPFVTAAMVSGSTMAAAGVVLALMGQPFPDLAPTSWALFGCWAAVGPLLLFVESRANSAKYAEWRRFMEHKTPWDILMGRHIPDLRKGGA